MAKCSACGAYVKEGHDCNKCGIPGPCGPSRNAFEREEIKKLRSEGWTIANRKDWELYPEAYEG